MTQKPMRYWIWSCPMPIRKRYVVKGRTKKEAMENLRNGEVERPLDDDLDVQEGVGRIDRECDEQ